jgi:predicted O-methyltransferase YrrM
MGIRAVHGVPTADTSMLKIRSYAAGTDGFMTHRERETLVALLEFVRAQTVVEIGVQLGQCARIMLDRVPTIEAYVGVDVLPGYVTPVPEQQTECPQDRVGELVLMDPRFQLITKRNGSLDLKAGDLPSCDVMVIDGDHSAAGVSYDTELAASVVRSGGLIVWHDYWPPFQNGVVEVLNALWERGCPIRHIEDTWLAMEWVR